MQFQYHFMFQQMSFKNRLKFFMSFIMIKLVLNVITFHVYDNIYIDMSFI
jgi:hypothetical protein